MKKSVLIAMVFFIATTTAYTQKKNGTVYNEHPGIAVVEAMQQAYIAGNADLVASYLTDGFKEWDGSDTNRDVEGTNKEDFVKGAVWWSKNLSYLSIERQDGAYPDAIKYKGDDGMWIQTWDVLKGVHTKTGSKINMPIHRLFSLDEDNKIKAMISYYNDEVFADIGRSFDERTNGVIYDNHEYINSVKMAFAAFENGDLETAYGFFDEDATFRNSSMLPGDKNKTLAEVKESNISFLDNFEVLSIDMNGYPDYLHYERGDIHLVQSWWTVRLIRKSDNKEITVPAFYTHTFNDDGKIRNGSSYINAKLFEE